MNEDELTQVKRSQIATYIDTTPTQETPTWKLLGIGITQYGIAYNPQITTDKWIIHDNATSTLDSNQKQGDVTQKMYKGDPCFEYVNGLRDKVGGDVKTHILDIDMWGGTGSTYPAKMSDAILAVTNYGGENASIEYSLYYNGDPTEGTATVTSGTPTFTEDEE